MNSTICMFKFNTT